MSAEHSPFLRQPIVTLKQLREACESYHQEQLSKKLEALTEAYNVLYDNLPTGEIDAFELLKVIQIHMKRLEKIIS